MKSFPFIMLFSLGLASCGAEPESGMLSISLRHLAITGPMADPGTPTLDETGLMDLSRFPMGMMARVESEDLEAPVVVMWPESVPEELPEEIDLDISVESGQNRRVFVELFLAEEDYPPATFASPAPGDSPTIVEVTPGGTVTLELTLNELPRANVRATWTPGVEIEAVAWVDDAAGVVWPSVAVADGASEAVIAVDRLYWPRVWLADGTQLDLEEQRIRAEDEGEIVDAVLELE